MMGFDLSYRADRIAAMLCGLLLAGAAILFVMAYSGPSDADRALAQSIRDEIAATPLVRICSDGTRIYRKDGRLYVYALGGGQYFENGVTTEAACPGR